MNSVPQPCGMPINITEFLQYFLVRKYVTTRKQTDFSLSLILGRVFNTLSRYTNFYLYLTVVHGHYV